MASFTIYGPAFSTYVRSVRLLLEEKGAPYELVEVDVLKGEHKEPAHLARHPFGKVPAFEHDGFALYETDAILRYADEVVPGPSFQPSDPKARARMNQVIGIINGYAYRSMIGKIVIQRVVVPMVGGQTDMAVVEDAEPEAELCLREFARILGNHEWLAGPTMSLADLMLAPIMAYFRQVPEGAMLDGYPTLKAWSKLVGARPSMVRTAPKLG